MRRYIRAARVLTSTSRGVIEDGALAIDDTRIIALGPASEFQQELANAQVEHFPTGTVLPGLVDAHAHLTLPANRQTYEQMFLDSDEMMALTSVRNLQRHLVSGVMTIRVVGRRTSETFIVRVEYRRR